MNYHDMLNELTVERDEIISEWAEAEQTAQYLEDTKKSLLSSIMNEMVLSGKHSEKALERMAYSDERYVTHLRGMGEARKQANILKQRLDAIKEKQSIIRSYLSYEKAQMTMV